MLIVPNIELHRLFFHLSARFNNLQKWSLEKSSLHFCQDLSFFLESVLPGSFIHSFHHQGQAEVVNGGAVFHPGGNIIAHFEAFEILGEKFFPDDINNGIVGLEIVAGFEFLAFFGYGEFVRGAIKVVSPD